MRKAPFSWAARAAKISQKEGRPERARRCGYEIRRGKPILEENKIMADALRKIGEIAVPPDAKLRDWKDALAEAQRIADEARERCGVMEH